MDEVFQRMVDNAVETTDNVYKYVEMTYPRGTEVRVLGQCWLGANVTGIVSDYDFHSIKFIRIGIKDYVTNHIIFLRVDEIEIVKS